MDLILCYFALQVIVFLPVVIQYEYVGGGTFHIVEICSRMKLIDNSLIILIFLQALFKETREAFILELTMPHS